MSALVGYMLLFLGVGIFFIFIHLMVGKLVRPAKPEPEKLTIYECGEPTIGSAWIQFDLRYYVVALLFVIFDVEVAFFFPWAIVFGKANDLSRTDLSQTERTAISRQLQPPLPPLPGDTLALITAEDAGNFALVAMLDIAVFFGVLLVGFAYLWKRGDIDWVKTVAAERLAEPSQPAAVLPKPTPAGTLVGAGQQ